jgi:hypothetical protein
MVRHMKRWFAIAARIVALLAGVGAAVALGLKDTLKPTQAWTIALVVLAGASGGVEQIRGVWQSVRAPKRQGFREDLALTLHGLAFDLGKLTGVDTRCFGVSVYRIPGHRWPWRLLPLKAEFRNRFSGEPGPSHIKWTRGKGMIGLCWEEQSTQYKDLRAIIKRHANITREKFDGLRRPDVKMGLNFDEFHRIVGKYAEVRAVPISNRDRTRMIGVLAVDIPADKSSPGDLPRLDAADVREVTSTAARIVGNLMS